VFDFVELFIIVTLILCSGFFAGAEIALIAAKRGRLKQLAEEHDRKAQLALELASQPNRFMPTVQLGITITGVFAATFGGESLIDEFATQLRESTIGLVARHAKLIAFIVVSGTIAYLSVVVGELVPKRFALKYATELSRWVAAPIYWTSVIGRPFVWVMGKSTDVILWGLGAGASHEESKVSVEDIEHLIETGGTHGALAPAEQKLAMEAIRLGDRTVRDIMRPRIDIDALDINTPPREVLGAVAMSGFSRVPIYDGDMDHITGFINIKDVLRRHYLGVPIDLRKIMHPPLFVPETLPVDRLLAMFQKNHTQMAIVLDEFGGTEGLVTLEDVVSELVGDIRDENRRDDEQLFVQREDGSWLVDGTVAIEQLLEKFNVKEPSDGQPRKYRTLAGLILTEIGQIPRVGEAVEWQGLRLEVIDMDGTRIDRVLISRVLENAAAESG